jgi:pimeloyl-ACP methyl ester carboxylesterase
VEHALRAKEAVPQARLVVLDNCGHFPQIEATSEFNATLLDWLAETEPQPVDARTLLHSAAAQA